MTPSLVRSYSYCEQLARREAGNFYHGFRILPRGQRLAMCALYAFMRVADDLGDEPAKASSMGHISPMGPIRPIMNAKRALEDWRSGLTAALEGRYSHRLHEALHHAVETYHIPAEHLHAVLDGVEMDLEPVSFATFDDLRLYCYRVASAVGLACIHVWGFTDERAKAHAENAGLAFQLTNILRDLGEDARRGRVYLPREDLERFGYDAQSLLAGRRDEHFRALMNFQVQRARSYYDAAWPIVAFLPSAGRAVFLIMARTYRALLDVIEKRDFDVFSSRVSLSPLRKIVLAAGALPVRWGWA